MRISFEEDLKGRAVIDGTGRVLGTIDGLLVDSESWRVEAFHAKMRREVAEQLGLARRTFHSAVLEIPVTLIHAAGDAVILNVPLDALRELKPAAEEEASSPA